LDIDRDEFLTELPRLLDRLKTMLVEKNFSLRAATGGTMKALLKRSVAAGKASRRDSMTSVIATVRNKLKKRQHQQHDNDTHMDDKTGLKSLRDLQVLKAHEKVITEISS
jgi:hypothetical protein